jgi:hypothetical protein
MKNINMQLNKLKRKHEEDIMNEIPIQKKPRTEDIIQKRDYLKRSREAQKEEEMQILKKTKLEDESYSKYLKKEALRQDTLKRLHERMYL